MKKKALIALFLIGLLIGGVSVITSAARSEARQALAAYKAKLRRQGEKLTFAEAGYPFPLETNSNLENFVLLVDRLSSLSRMPERLDCMPSAASGTAVVSWAAAVPYSFENGASNDLQWTWEQLAMDCNSAAPTLAEIRSELEHPPLHSDWNDANALAYTLPDPGPQKRIAARFLTADLLSALHSRQLARAQTNLHALTQLSLVHRDDLARRSAMLRLGIARVGLEATWEALAAEGWNEDGLLALQHDWELVDLIEAVENSFAGERIFGEDIIMTIRKTGSYGPRGMFPSSSSPMPDFSSFSDIKDKILEAGRMAYWHQHIDEDELFYLKYCQTVVETTRKLKTNASGALMQNELRAQRNEFGRVMNASFGGYRYQFSAVAIPNQVTMFGAAVQHESRRRMTVTVIALSRFHLRNGRYPTTLSDLVPQFIAAELMDPWSGKPLRYRLNADGAFTLYSVGEDGRDDGGDPTSSRSTSDVANMWPGKDKVWPTPVFPEKPEKRK